MIEANLTRASHRAKEPSNLDDLFEMYFTGTGGRANKPISMQGDIGWRPATDVYETSEEFIIQMDLSGMEKDEIQVSLEDDFIHIKGIRSNIAFPGKKHFHKMEIQVGPFERHVRIPEGVDATTARAHYDTGFLFVRIQRGTSQWGERRTVEIESES
jgi:HSP20 family protein